LRNGCAVSCGLLHNLAVSYSTRDPSSASMLYLLLYDESHFIARSFKGWPPLRPSTQASVMPAQGLEAELYSAVHRNSRPLSSRADRLSHERINPEKRQEEDSTNKRSVWHGMQASFSHQHSISTLHSEEAPGATVVSTL
jgi:hypothetical protein